MHIRHTYTTYIAIHVVRLSVHCLNSNCVIDMPHPLGVSCLARTAHRVEMCKPLLLSKGILLLLLLPVLALAYAFCVSWCLCTSVSCHCDATNTLIPMTWSRQ
eukprot:m.367666 g.367666  ORF g.367666 m.367666 type:complete len:103 (-) comp41951_c0_seq1:141-449(-)